MRVAQPLAAWLIAKPLHTVLGLGLTLLLPFAQIFTGAAITVVVLAQGLAKALALAAVAAVLVGVLAWVTGAAQAAILVNALMFWVPAALVAALLRGTRSLPLTFQVTVILALVGTVLIHAAIADPVAFWTEQIGQVAAAFREMGLDQQAGLLVAQQDVLAPQMTVLFVATTWSLLVLVFALGYSVFQALPDQESRFGRFYDLNLGRFLAAAVAVASVFALLTGAGWLKDVAFVGIATFWVQGLALLHWLRAEGPMPAGMLIVVYALLPVLNVLLVLALAALGYSDAWFDYRARARRGKAG